MQVILVRFNGSNFDPIFCALLGDLSIPIYEALL